MSCEDVCAQGVAQLGNGHRAAPSDLAAIRAIYDAKPELQPGEDLATLRRQAKLLTTRFRQMGLKLPEHLDLDDSEGIVAIRYGRAYAELQRRGWLQQPKVAAGRRHGCAEATALARAVARRVLDQHSELADLAAGAPGTDPRGVLLAAAEALEQTGQPLPAPLRWARDASPQQLRQVAPIAAAAVCRQAGVEQCPRCHRFVGQLTHTCPPPSPPAVERLRPVLEAVRAAGGVPLVVGGAVRDMVTGTTPKDADIEVYGLDGDTLAAALGQFGSVNAVGKSFGVLKVRIGEDELDVSVPRRENKAGQGHKGFVVTPDATMPPWEAAGRRDFTFNALAYDPDTGTTLDFYGGQADLQAQVLRHTSPAFAEDPLRVLRAMQFAARFEMTLAPETAELCRSLLPEAATLPKERLWAEFQKLALKGKHPRQGLEALRDSGWLEHFPHLAVLPGVEQDSFYHPEGDVWVHTGMVVDAAAAVATRDGLDDHDRTVLMFAALCHDLAKPATTKAGWQVAEPQPDGARPSQGWGPEWQPDPERAGGWRRWRVSSHGHEEAGEPLAEAFLRQIGAPDAVIAEVKPLVRLHLRHIPLVRLQREIAALPSDSPDLPGKQRDLDRLVRRLAVEVAPSSFAQLVRLIEADMSGRHPLPPQNPCGPLVERAGQLQVAAAAPAAVLRGRDLIAAGLAEPGPQMGAMLKRAYEAQLDGSFSTVEEALAWLRANPSPDEPRRAA